MCAPAPRAVCGVRQLVRVRLARSAKPDAVRGWAGGGAGRQHAAAAARAKEERERRRAEARAAEVAADAAAAAAALEAERGAARAALKVRGAWAAGLNPAGRLGMA